MSEKRSVLALIGWGIVWTLVFWVVSLFLVGMFAGGSDPENAERAGEAMGQTFAGPLFLVALVLAVPLTFFGVMPGTRKKFVDYEALFGDGPANGGLRPVDLESLERLAALHKQGVLTDEEFATQKANVLRTGR